MHYQCRLKTLTPQRFAAIRTVTTPAAFGTALSDLLARVWQTLNRLERVTVGPAIARYHNADPDAIDVEAGFPIAEEIEVPNPVQLNSLPDGKAATTLHWGPYAGISDGWAALEQWMRDERLAPASDRWEIYWVDPSQTQDADQLRTELVWLVRGAEGAGAGRRARGAGRRAQGRAERDG